MSSDPTLAQSSLLEARSLEVVYANGVKALAPTSLRMAAGEFIVLLGPSGAGKSSLIRALNGLVRPSGGEVWLQGLGVPADRESQRILRTQVAMVFQQHQLIGRRSALYNVLTGRLGYHSGLRTLFALPRADRLIALDALDRVGLLDKALQRCDQLSGGQQQRVGIARALAQQPRVMLADEPVASLDPATAERVLTLMQAVCREKGIAAMVSLHQVELARRFAHRIVALAAGAMVFDGAPDELNDAAVARIYAPGSVTGIPASEPERQNPFPIEATP